jgi:hypothetical protein
MQVQWLIPCPEMSLPASSRSQRGISTTLTPAYTEPRTLYSMPVMWNMGTTPSTTGSAPPP